jgi:hypothetical protein
MELLFISGWLIVFSFLSKNLHILVILLYYFLVIWHALRRYLGTTDRGVKFIKLLFHI